MNTADIKMIVTDLDRTLLKSDLTISDYTVDVLKRCQQRGIKVAFATARSTRAASRFIERVLPDAFIGYGGGLVMESGKTVYCCEIPKDISNALIQECLNHPDIRDIYAIGEGFALSNNQDYMNDNDWSHYQYCDFSEPLRQGCLKISVNSAYPTSVKKIAAHFPSCDMLQYTGEDLFRFANINALKWNALLALSEHYGIDTANIAAFGDDVNDIEMLRESGFGIAVDNAYDTVKSVAGYMCGTNDNDGVARWIEEHVLNT